MSTEPDVMVVDDDEDFREATYELLVDTGIKVEKFAYADPMLAALDPEWPGVVLCDVRMAGRDGFQTLKRLEARTRCAVHRDHGLWRRSDGCFCDPGGGF